MCGLIAAIGVDCVVCVWIVQVWQLGLSWGGLLIGCIGDSYPADVAFCESVRFFRVNEIPRGIIDMRSPENVIHVV